MRCLTCHYDLTQLTENRCPECGRAFDPKNDFTFLSNRNSVVVDLLQGARVAVYIALSAPTIALLVALFPIASVELDEPSVQILFLIASVMLLADFVIIIALIIEGWRVRRLVYRRIIPAVLLVVALWLTVPVILVASMWLRGW